MTNKNSNVNVTVNVAFATPNTTTANSTSEQEHTPPTAYYPIADGDFDSMKYYESNGYAVRHINAFGRKRWFVLIPVSSQEEADHLNKTFDTLRKQEEREYIRRHDKEISYESLLEDGYDPASEESDLADIASNLITIEALVNEFQKLSDEKKRICRAVMNGQSDYKAAEELHLARTTYRDRKARILDELADLLCKFK